MLKIQTKIFTMLHGVKVKEKGTLRRIQKIRADLTLAIVQYVVVYFQPGVLAATELPLSV